MNRNHVLVTLAVCSTVALSSGLVSRAGDLNPPVGPVAPTYKTLTEVEPRIAINATNTPGDASCLFNITQSGSYYLTDNIQGVANKHGIKISIGGVTLDLNGYHVAGLGGAGDFDGISAPNGSSNIDVRNGSVFAWPGDGVDLGTATNCTISGIRSRLNGQAGISVGTNTSVSDSVSGGNTGIGFATSSGCVITGCSSASNVLDGFLLGSGTTITGCTAYLNGDDGIQVNNGCTVSACTCYANTADGVKVAGAGCVIATNTCTNNGFGAGNGACIHVTVSDNRIEGNNCTNADRGIEVGAGGNIIIRNTCSGNTNNWNVVAGNVILVVNATTAAAVTGNSGGTAPGSTDPNANFTY